MNPERWKRRPRMNRRRLRIMAEHLKMVPREHFYLSFWENIDGGKIKNGSIVEVGCETTACAMGWACSIPEFREAGLRLAPMRALWWGKSQWKPVFGGRSGYVAGAMFFGVSVLQSEWLFSPAEYLGHNWDNPLAVVARIEELLKK